MLNKYHTETSPRVLDCCQGEAKLWNQLRREFEIAKYLGVDLKPKRGRLKIDSRAILSRPGWFYDVVDIDTYGSPWRHLEALVNTLKSGVTVFITIGRVMMGVDKAELKALGLHNLRNLPPTLGSKVVKNNLSTVLTSICSSVTIQEMVESPPGRNARYIAIRLKREGPGAGTPGPKPKTVRKEPS